MSALVRVCVALAMLILLLLELWFLALFFVRIGDEIRDQWRKR